MTIKCKIRTEPQKRQALFPVKSYFSRGGKISSNKSPILKWLKKINKYFKDVFEKVHKSIHFVMFRLGNVKNSEKTIFFPQKENGTFARRTLLHSTLLIYIFFYEVEGWLIAIIFSPKKLPFS